MIHTLTLRVCSCSACRILAGSECVRCSTGQQHHSILSSSGHRTNGNGRETQARLVTGGAGQMRMTNPDSAPCLVIAGLYKEERCNIHCAEMVGIHRRIIVWGLVCRFSVTLGDSERSSRAAPSEGPPLTVPAAATASKAAFVGSGSTTSGATDDGPSPLTRGCRPRCNAAKALLLCALASTVSSSSQSPAADDPAISTSLCRTRQVPKFHANTIASETLRAAGRAAGRAAESGDSSYSHTK